MHHKTKSDPGTGSHISVPVYYRVPCPHRTSVPGEQFVLLCAASGIGNTSRLGSSYRKVRLRTGIAVKYETRTSIMHCLYHWVPKYEAVRVMTAHVSDPPLIPNGLILS